MSIRFSTGMITVLLILAFTLTPAPAQAQHLKNVKQIYERPGYFLIEPTPDLDNRYFALCVQGNQTSQHLLYAVKNGDVRAITPGTDDPFGDAPEINTWSLIWSPKVRGEFLVKSVTDKKQIQYRIFNATKLGTPAKILSLKLDDFQMMTSQPLAWNPSGILYLRLAKPGLNNNQDIKAADYDIYVLNGNNPVSLTQNPDFSEDQAALLGKNQLVFAARDSAGFNDLFIQKALGKSQVTNITKSVGLSENWPQPSPDNRWVATIITSEKDNTGDLWVVSTQAPFTPRKLVASVYFEGISPLPAGRFQWDQTGRGIYYIKQDPERQCPLEYVDFQTGHVTTVTDGIAFVSSFAISPDNRHILFVASGMQGSLHANTHKAYVAELIN